MRCWLLEAAPPFLNGPSVGASVAKDDKDESAKGDYEFKLPDFDEDTFIHREIVSFKTTAILFGWGIVAAAVSWAAFTWLKGETGNGWMLGLIICATFGFSLKWLYPKLGIDVAHFKRREWMGTGFLFFFTWLAFFMVAINPPLSDFAAPQVLLSANPPAQLENGTVNLAMLAVDNDRIASSDLTVLRNGQPYPLVATGRTGEMQWFNLSALPTGTYTVTGTATDGHGLTTHAWANFTVSGTDFTYISPPQDTLSLNTKLTAQLPAKFPPCDKDHYNKVPCVRAIYIDVGDHDIVMDANVERPGEWSADVNSKGWTKGVNSFSLRAEFLNHFQGAHSVAGGTLELAGPFTVNVTAEPGAHVADVPPLVPIRNLNVPHLELPALVVVIFGLAAVARRRK